MFSGEWPADWRDKNITLLEFYPIVVALFIFTEELRNKRVCFHTDNNALVYIINNQTSKENNVMILVRKFVLQCLTNNIVFKAKHIPGKHNIIADLLSRLQVQQAFSQAPWLNKVPTDVPAEMLPTNIMQKM